MTRCHVIVGIMLVSILAVSLAFAGEPKPNIGVAVAGNNAFALDLYAMLKKEQGNLFFSPYSISSALAMTYGGARGDTAEEMATALRFTLGEDEIHPAFAQISREFDKIHKKGQVQLHVANSLWPQKDYSLLPRYVALIKQNYGVSITPVDYVKAAEDARKIINAWVEEETKEKIKDLIRPGDLGPLTVLVLVNAIYFKGNWASQFDPKRTQESEFTVSHNMKTQVQMMYQRGKFGYGEIEGAKLLELPYVGKELSMVIILPEEPNGLSKVEDQFTLKNFDSWIARISEQDVNVYLPKFKVTWGTFELNELLKGLGMRKAFGPADFSGMDGTRTLFIGLVLHKAFLEVNEEGTEAAAATSVVMTRSVPGIHMFKADHPFFFLIKDNVTGSILLLGRILDPSKQ